MRPINPIKRIRALHNRCLALIEGEINQLEMLQQGLTGGRTRKLGRDAAKDLRDIIKLLSDMEEAHQAILKAKQAEKATKDVSDDELLETALKAKKD